MTDVLKTVAEAVENVMLEQLATGVILDYCVDLVRDDGRIVVCMVKNVPVKCLEFSFVLKRGSGMEMKYMGAK